MPEVFDNIANNLASNPAFEVIRSPLPLIYLDDERHRRGSWSVATANNYLVEIGGNSKTVWLPTYGHGVWAELAITEQANKETWENLVFDVVLWVDSHPRAEDLGAVHWITNYLGRHMAPPIFWATLSMLVDQDRIAVRVDQHQASWPSSRFICLSSEGKALIFEMPLDVAYIFKVVQFLYILIPARIERQDVALKHPLKQPN